MNSSIVSDWLELFKAALEDAYTVEVSPADGVFFVRVTSKRMDYSRYFEFHSTPARVMRRPIRRRGAQPPTIWKAFNAVTAKKLRTEMDLDVDRFVQSAKLRAEHADRVVQAQAQLKEEFAGLPEVKGVRIAGWLDDQGVMHRHLDIVDTFQNMTVSQIRRIVEALHEALANP